MIFDTKKLQNICEANDISYLGLFGSYAVGKQREDSDVDLLVDLVSRKNIKPLLKPFINKQLILLYGEKNS